MIKTESGQWIPATYKSGRYKAWQEKNRIEEQLDDGSEGEENENERKSKRKSLYVFFQKRTV